MLANVLGRAWLTVCVTACQGCLFPPFDDLRCDANCEGGAPTTTAGGGGAGQGGDPPGGGGQPIGGGGAGGDGGEGGGPGNPCADPLGRGADGVLMDPPGDTFPSYCIDSVEVSFARYKDFLDALVFMGDPEFDGYKSTECATTDRDIDEFENHYAIGQALATNMYDPLPAVGMSWCQAQIHCRWAGKELCGHLDGTGSEAAGQPEVAQWVAACSNFGDTIYSYGDTYDVDICKATACTPNDFHVLDPAAPNGCEGGVPGLYNMSANAHELTDSCVPAGTSAFDDDDCLIRGGCCGLLEYTSCEFTQTVKRNNRGNYVSFRCCWAPRSP